MLVIMSRKSDEEHDPRNQRPGLISGFLRETLGFSAKTKGNEDDMLSSCDDDVIGGEGLEKAVSELKKHRHMAPFGGAIERNKDNTGDVKRDNIPSVRRVEQSHKVGIDQIREVAKSKAKTDVEHNEREVGGAGLQRFVSDIQREHKRKREYSSKANAEVGAKQGVETNVNEQKDTLTGSTQKIRVHRVLSEDIYLDPIPNFHIETAEPNSPLEEKREKYLLPAAKVRENTTGSLLSQSKRKEVLNRRTNNGLSSVGEGGLNKRVNGLSSVGEGGFNKYGKDMIISGEGDGEQKEDEANTYAVSVGDMPVGKKALHYYVAKKESPHDCDPEDEPSASLPVPPPHALEVEKKQEEDRQNKKSRSRLIIKVLIVSIWIFVGFILAKYIELSSAVSFFKGLSFF